MARDLNPKHLLSSCCLWVCSGKDGSWMTNTLTTPSPSLHLTLATLKNLVLPRLEIAIKYLQVTTNRISSCDEDDPIQFKLDIEHS